MLAQTTRHKRTGSAVWLNASDSLDVNCTNLSTNTDNQPPARIRSHNKMRRTSLSIRYRNSRARLAATRTRPPASPDRELAAIARLSKRRYCSKRDLPCKLFDNAYLLVSSKYLSAFLLLLTTRIPYWPTAQQRRRSQLLRVRVPCERRCLFSQLMPVRSFRNELRNLSAGAKSCRGHNGEITQGRYFYCAYSPEVFLRFCKPPFLFFFPPAR